MQYTIRGIPDAVDHAIRERAKAEGKSLNEVVIEALRRALGLAALAPVTARDLSDLAGSWESDPEVDRVLREQRTIDEDKWS